MTEKGKPFPIVGIGASAGGQSALTAFFTTMADQPGMAFVLVQHLAPDHKSILAELIQHHTRMPVGEVVDGMTVRPNQVYDVPPNRDMALINGTLHLLAPFAPRGHRLPIDFFFRSLAQDQQDLAIGIWTPGCSTDEESYPLAILLAECQEKLKQNSTVQIFATDIDDRATAVARSGLCPESIAADVTASRLARYSWKKSWRWPGPKQRWAGWSRRSSPPCGSRCWSSTASFG
jgi:hypothetical protein